MISLGVQAVAIRNVLSVGRAYAATANESL